jgi:hypothetical protein
MGDTQHFSHVAVTLPRDYFGPAKRAELLAFYGEVFGWAENTRMSIEGERIFLRAPTDRQYLTLRASDDPMRTSGYEHLGIWVESLDELQELFERARVYAARDDRVELGEMKSLYGERLQTFRVRYLLPLTLELQHLEDAP